MADFKLGPDGDVVMEGGDFVWVTGPDAIRQSIEFELRVGLGECTYATNRGTPWFQVLFLDSTTDEARRFILRQIVKRVPGVIDCLQLVFSTDAQNRIQTITGAALTEDGEATFNIDGTPNNAA
jgi:hypothetical protein